MTENKRPEVRDVTFTKQPPFVSVETKPQPRHGPGLAALLFAAVTVAFVLATSSPVGAALVFVASFITGMQFGKWVYFWDIYDE